MAKKRRKSRRIKHDPHAVDLRDLEDVCHLYELLQRQERIDIAAAAAKMKRSADAVYDLVERIEQKFVPEHLDGTWQLIARGQGVDPALTPQADALYRFARKAVDAFLDFDRKKLASQERIVIKATGAAVTFLLPLVFAGDFLDRHPGVEIVIDDGDSEEIVGDVQGRRADIGLVTEGTSPRRLDSAPVIDVARALLCKTGHAFREWDRVAPFALAHLAEERVLLLPRGAVPGHDFLELLPLPVRCGQRMVLPHTDVCYQWIKRGGWVGIGYLDERLLPPGDESLIERIDLSHISEIPRARWNLETISIP